MTLQGAGARHARHRVPMSPIMKLGHEQSKLLEAGRDTWVH